MDEIVIPLVDSSNMHIRVSFITDVDHWWQQKKLFIAEKKRHSVVHLYLIKYIVTFRFLQKDTNKRKLFSSF